MDMFDRYKIYLLTFIVIFSCLCYYIEGIFKILENILHIFQPHTEPDQSISDPSLISLLQCSL